MQDVAAHSMLHVAVIMISAVPSLGLYYSAERTVCMAKKTIKASSLVIMASCAVTRLFTAIKAYLNPLRKGTGPDFLDLDSALMLQGTK